MSLVNLREYKDTDYQSILKLWKVTNLGGEERGDNSHSIELSLLREGKFWVLEDITKVAIIGCCWLTNDSRRLYMHHLGVLPEYQRKGYGRLLTETALAYAKSVTMQIKLEVHHTNKRAIDIYKRLGFDFLEGYKVMIKRKHK